MNRLAGILNAKAHYLFVILVAILPVAFLPFLWATMAQSKTLIFIVFTVAVSLAWLGVVFIRRKGSVPLSAIFGAGLLLPIAYAISAFGAAGAEGSFVGSGIERDTVAAMIMWAAVMLAAAMFAGGTTIKRSYEILVAIGGISALFHLTLIGIKNTALASDISTLVPATLIGSWHNLAIFSGFIVLLSVFGFGYGIIRDWKRWLAIVVTALNLILLILVNARDVWTSLAAVSALAALYLFLKSRNEDTLESAHARRGGLLITILTVAAISAIFAAVSPIIRDNMPERLQVAQLEVRPSWEGTLTVANSVYQERSLLFGSGPNTFVKQWGFYKPAGVNETAFWNTNFTQGIGFVPTGMVITGVVGSVAWVLFLLAVIVEGGIIVFSRNSASPWRLPLLAVFAGVLYLWILHIIYPPSAAIVALAFIMTGLLVAGGRASGVLRTYEWSLSRVSASGIAIASLLAATGVVIIIAGAGMARLLAADMLVNKSVIEFNESRDFESAQRKLQTALAVAPKYDRALRAAVEINLLQFAELVSGGDETQQEAVRASLERVIRNGLSAVSSDSANYQNWLTLAQAYEQLVGVQVEGAYENALTAYEQAIERNPTNPEPHLRLARLAVLRGDNDSARGHLEDALARKSNYSQAHMLLSQIEVADGNLSAAEESAVAAVRFDLTQSSAWFQLGAVLYVRENYDNAVAALTEALARDANYANALYVLGLSQSRLGNNAEAIRAFSRVLDLNPGNAEVEALIESLKTLEESAGVE